MISDIHGGYNGMARSSISFENSIFGHKTLSLSNQLSIVEYRYRFIFYLLQIYTQLLLKHFKENDIEKIKLRLLQALL